MISVLKHKRQILVVIIIVMTIFGGASYLILRQLSLRVPMFVRVEDTGPVTDASFTVTTTVTMGTLTQTIIFDVDYGDWNIGWTDRVFPFIKGETVHFTVAFSDRTDTFTDTFILGEDDPLGKEVSFQTLTIKIG